MPRYTALDLLLVLIAVVVLPTLSALGGRTLARTPSGELRLVGRYCFIIARGIAIALLILLSWRWAGREDSELGLDMPIGLRGRIGFGLDLVLAGYYVYALLLRKLSAERIAGARRRLESYRILPRTRMERALFPFVGIVGSVFEELLFRGFLIWFFTPIAGLWAAVLASSVVFGFGHAYQGWIGILRTGVIGLAFAIGYALTRSLWWLIVAHITVSLCGDLFARRLLREAPALAQPPA